MDLMDWIFAGAPLACIAMWIILDKIYRSLDDGWLEGHFHKKEDE